MSSSGENATKYIFVTGGVSSSLGKGITSSSIGTLLQAQGYTVKIRKLDPYLNIDPGTMSPYQHGEVFVTDDGAETDLDLGHYERFTSVPAKASDSITTGQIYATILEQERQGKFLGKTVQVIPHVTNAIKKFITNDHTKYDFIICEIGGTVGDIESLPFLEAIRQLRNELGNHLTLFVHLTLLPYINSAKELKTKPTQHAVKELLSLGIQADILVCRCEHKIPNDAINKIALFCNISEKRVIPALDATSIYEVPLNFHKNSLDEVICNFFSINFKHEVKLEKWHNFVQTLKNPQKTITVGVIGKYLDHSDSYKSIDEAMVHAGVKHKAKIIITPIDSEKLTPSTIQETFSGINGILIPGGFGLRGTDGKMLAIQYAREHKIPFFGICLGMQLAVIEFARNILGIHEANSTEILPHCKVPIIDVMTQWHKENRKEKREKNGNLGGTMRLGQYPTRLTKGSKLYKIYGHELISERHRHRYEVNISFKEKFENMGLLFSGLSPDSLLTEAIELKDHPWFVAVQYHPEFKSQPFQAHPLFVSFVEACLANIK